MESFFGYKLFQFTRENATKLKSGTTFRTIFKSSGHKDSIVLSLICFKKILELFFFLFFCLFKCTEALFCSAVFLYLNPDLVTMTAVASLFFSFVMTFIYIMSFAGECYVYSHHLNFRMDILIELQADKWVNEKEVTA